MTTEHLDIDDDLDAKLGVLGNDASNRPGEIEKAIKGKERHVRNIARGASVLIQRRVDEIDDLREEAEQMDQIDARTKRILGVLDDSIDQPDDSPDPVRSTPEPPPDPGRPGSSVFAPPEPPEEPDLGPDWLNCLYTISQLEGMSNSRLQQLAGTYGMDGLVTYHNRHTVIARIVDAQRRWCDENDDVDPNPVSSTPAPVGPPTAVNPNPNPPAPPSWQQWVRDLSTPIWLLILLIAIVVFFAVLAITSHNHETILGWAAGDAKWQDNGWAQFVIIAGPPTVIAYTVWYVLKSYFDNS